MALSWHAVLPGTARGEARKGFVRLEVAVPSSVQTHRVKEHGSGECDHRDGSAQAIGHDRGHRPGRAAVGRFGTDRAGYAEMLAAGRTYPDRVWAVEGCNGIGKHIAHRLIHDGEVVFDVPPKLSASMCAGAGVRYRQRPQDRPVDAHSVAMAALYAPVDPGLRRVEVDDDLVVMGLLVDRRDELAGPAPRP